MPSYETLDAIADAYIPMLAVIALLFIAIHLLKARWKQAGIGLAGFAAAALVAYGFMYLDRALNIWPAFGLDYSTHTATALGLVMLLSLQTRLAFVWLGSLLIYILLMLYQRYHTVADIVTTAVVVAMPLALLLTPLYRPLHHMQNP